MCQMYFEKRKESSIWEFPAWGRELYRKPPGPDTGGANGAIWPGRYAPERGRHSQGAPVRAPLWEAYLRSSTLPMGSPDSAPPVGVFVHHKRCLWERLVSKTTIVHYQLLKWCQPAPPTNCFKNKIDKHTNVFYLNLKLLSGISKLWGL